MHKGQVSVTTDVGIIHDRPFPTLQVESSKSSKLYVTVYPEWKSLLA
jgi:hypothetical protein